MFLNKSTDIILCAPGLAKVLFTMFGYLLICK